MLHNGNPSRVGRNILPAGNFCCVGKSYLGTIVRKIRRCRLFRRRIEMKLDMRLDREDERSCVDGGCRILIIIDRFWCRVHCPIVENRQSWGDHPFRIPGSASIWHKKFRTLRSFSFPAHEAGLYLDNCIAGRKWLPAGSILEFS